MASSSIVRGDAKPATPPSAEPETEIDPLWYDTETEPEEKRGSSAVGFAVAGGAVVIAVGFVAWLVRS